MTYPIPMRIPRFISFTLMGLGTGVALQAALPAPTTATVPEKVLLHAQHQNHSEGIIRQSRLLTSVQQEDEAAIRQVVQKMQDGQNTKDGNLYASAFAQEHDYIVIDGTFIPSYTREDNASAHQALYNGRQSSLGGNLGKVSMQLEVAKIRFLAPEIAVVHIQSQAGLRDRPDKRAKNIITTVMQKQEGKWAIVAFHNAPVQKSEEDNFGFVIDIEGFKGKAPNTEELKR